MLIDDTVQKKAWKIWELSQAETEYRRMLEEIRELEKEYESALALLPKKQEDAVRDFLSHCEAMSWRMLQIACSMMDFSENGEK